MLISFGRRSGLQVPRANIGAMRFPEAMEDAVALIRHAIDSGMGYIDTSRGYGDSELKLAQALKDGYREKVLLSTKWSPWNVKIEETDDASADCVRRRIEESMKRLDVDYLDFYQIWSVCSREHWEMATGKGGMLEGILKAKEEGLIRHVGFTTHDSVENLLSYLPELDWCEVVLFTYNMLNRRYAPVMKAYHDAGIGTIVMNPVGGGKLKEASEVLVEVAQKAGAVSIADLAIRFIFSNPDIDCIIPGITRFSDVDDSIASSERGGLGAEQMQIVEALLDEVGARQKEFCTACGYCMPCPQGIDIPKIMACIFDDRFWGFRESARQAYLSLPDPKADACIQCGQCEEKCTQKLKIMDELEGCKKLFG